MCTSVFNKPVRARRDFEQRREKRKRYMYVAVRRTHKGQLSSGNRTYANTAYFGADSDPLQHFSAKVQPAAAHYCLALAGDMTSTGKASPMKKNCQRCTKKAGRFFALRCRRGMCSWTKASQDAERTPGCAYLESA